MSHTMCTKMVQKLNCDWLKDWFEIGSELTQNILEGIENLLIEKVSFSLRYVFTMLRYATVRFSRAVVKVDRFYFKFDFEFSTEFATFNRRHNFLFELLCIENNS